MIKVITLLSRKAGMSKADFRQYYENNHRLLGEKYLTGYAAHYQRRYVCSNNTDTQYGIEPNFDVVMEIWFPDQKAMQEAMAALAQPTAQAEIIADEEQLFDRLKTVSFVVDEVASTLPIPCNSREALE